MFLHHFSSDIFPATFDAEGYPKIPQVNETAGGVVKNVECKVDARGFRDSRFSIQEWVRLKMG